eukprot:TRINITY_DN8336_c0_g1_i1.p1 TRINITY_DN8336_c0_g1~~TRINITY_DN8336_c0_g1_i1.p1  ORF type:complete len:244 (-),score=43.06 TRINITY_DN8336_c0_g1_i1:37-714(-)
MFYSSVWDPRLILSQIATIQCVYYLSLGGMLMLLDLLSGYSLTFTQMFSYKATSMHTWHGWIVIVSMPFTSLAGAFGLFVVVERSKKCLDYTVTAWIFHLCTCWIYGGFPRGWTWWLVNIFSLILMAVLGEYLCMRREMTDIPLGRPLGSRGAYTQVTQSSSSSSLPQAGSSSSSSSSSIGDIIPDPQSPSLDAMHHFSEKLNASLISTVSVLGTPPLTSAKEHP